MYYHMAESKYLSTKSLYHSSAKRAPMFSFSELQREPSMIQPLGASRHSRNNRRGAKSTEAEALASALLNVVSVGRDFCDPNQVLGSGSRGFTEDSKHDSKSNLGDNHANSNLQQRSSQIAFADETNTSFVASTPFQPIPRGAFFSNENSTQSKYIKPPPRLPRVTSTPARANTQDTFTSMGHQNYENHAVARQRRPSAAIAIKKAASNPQSEADQAALANAVREYEWATWRLYDKIMSHRQRNQDLYERLAESHELYSDENLGIKGDTESESHPGLDEIATSVVDEGIFEIDL